MVQVLPPTKLAGQHFVLFLAWDASAIADEAIFAFARQLIRVGLSYVVAWGPDCERVHDIFDDADILENPESNVAETETVIISTWHNSDSLEEALWFAMHSAYPAPPYEPTTISTVAVVIGNKHWAHAVQTYLADLSKLNAAVGA
ncbi:MAG: hypothetical protein QOC81_4080 [Thermoanaerobaculia bacterium]|nr:hypothetical protein [Thermoanaerobaculia bacterium]